jgi:hypothetical protein
MKKRLKSITSGNKQWRDYEDIVLEIIKDCLSPEVISEPYDQVTSPSPDYRRDIILPLIAYSGFWHYISIVYGSTLLVVECKNYKNKITPHEVDSTYKYLRRPNVSNIGFIFSRKGANSEAFKTAIDIFRIEHKLLIFFNDQDLEKLIDFKGKPSKATNYIRDTYNHQKLKM